MFYKNICEHLEVPALRGRMFEPVAADSLVVFRIGFGLLLLLDVVRYFAAGWIDSYYLEPDFLFKYYGFEWVEPWPGSGLHWHFALTGVFALFVTVGFLYRLSAILFTLAFSYIFLLEQAQYLNHFYLVILIAMLMCILPANRYVSVDAWLRPRLRSPVVPRWAIWTLRAQMEVLLIYAGIVKLNPDWLRLEPLAMWLARRADYPLVGQLFTETWVVAVGAYGTILLHLVGAPLLLWRRTRFVVFLCYAVFHLANHFVFSIGIFPWLTLLGTLIFFEPDWPRRILARPWPAWGRQAAPVPDGPASKAGSYEPPVSAPRPATQAWLIGFLSVWFAFQVLVPLRHLLYPGNVSWTEEGHRFAWQMKLRTKQGAALFTVEDPASRQSWHVRGDEYLNRRQNRKMTCRPDMILQFSHYLAGVWRERGFPDVQVRASVRCSLNGRRPARLIDPDRDLARVDRDLRHADWILPLEEPLLP